MSDPQAALRARRFGEAGATLATVGEGGLLERLTAAAAAGVAPSGLVVGAGDDAAVWTPPAGRSVVITQDALVEDVDFRRGWITPYQLGRRALTLSLSDLAAMGARPSACVATVCASPSTRLDDMLAVQLGLIEAGAETGCALIGGDVSATAGPLVIDVCALGTVMPAAVLRRDRGGVGDALVLTGSVGRAAAGLRILRARDRGAKDALDGAEPADREVWQRAQLEPSARLAEGQALAATGVRCAGDVSDGLLIDTARTAAASGCGAELWRGQLPVDAALRALLPAEWPQLALGGGEDFELLAAVPPALLDRLLAGWRLTPLTVVGRLVAGAGVRLREAEGGADLPMPPPSSRHFA